MKKKDIKQEMRVEFATLWVKSAVHKNKKKYTRKLKHRKHGRNNQSKSIT